jgi:serine/threonine-protein kinase
VLSNVASFEPLPLRAINRDLPADLEAVVMKCLEKDRSARYDSARALADDLGRFLAGEPVLANAGLGYRLRKRLRKHARLVAGAGVALALLLTVLGYALWQRHQTARREELARSFTEHVARIESLARYSALARLHDARADRARIRAEMSALDGEIRAAGAIAAGPGHYALGCGYLALGEDERAAQELEAAWQGGFRAPRAAYALALATGHLYQRALRAVERVSSAELREQRRGEIGRRYRDPALLYLRASRGAEVPSLDYVAALIAFYEGRYDEALRSLDAIDKLDGGVKLAWFYEAPLLRGEILRARGRAHRLKGEQEQAAADFEAGRRAFAVAAGVGESDPVVHEALGELEYSALVAELYGRAEIMPPFDRGIAAADRALAILPDRVEALSLRARLERSLAEHGASRGDDVTALLTRATADAQRAVELAPAQRDARLELARTWRQWGEFRQIRGEDPAEQLGRAIEISNAIALAERDYDFHVHLGLCFALWANYQEQLGLDSQENRSRAIDAYNKAIQLNERLSDVWMNLGINYCYRAEQPRNRDADGDIARALDALERGHALVPRHIVPFFYRGRLHLLRARHSMATGGDPGPELTLALTAYREGLGINQRIPQLHSGIGTVLIEQARIAWDRGADPFPLLAQAKASYDEAAAVAPSFATAHHNAGKALTARALYLRARLEDPEATLRDAVAAFHRALALTPDDAEVWANLGMAEAIWAAAALDAGRSPAASLTQALAAVDRALAKAPRLKEALLADAETKAAQARWRSRTGQGSEQDFNAAASSFARALEVAPEDAAARVEYAAFCLTSASGPDEKLQDPTPALERGLDLTEQALKMRPSWPDALVLRGGLRLARARRAARGEQQRTLAGGAADDLRRALAANPNLRSRWRASANDAARLAGAAQ